MCRKLIAVLTIVIAGLCASPEMVLAQAGQPATTDNVPETPPASAEPAKEAASAPAEAAPTGAEPGAATAPTEAAAAAPASA